MLIPIINAATNHTLLLVIVLALASCSNATQRHRNTEVMLADRVILSCRDSIYTHPKEAEKQLRASRGKLRDSSAICLVETFIGTARLYQGDEAGMRHYYDKAEAYAKRHPTDSHLNGFVDNNIAVYKMLKGQRDSAVTLYGKASRAFMADGDTLRVCMVALNLASILRERGEMARAAGVLNDAFHYCQEKGNKTTLFAMYYTLGVIYADMHSFALSDEYFTHAQRIMRADSISLNDQFIFYNFRGNRYFYAREYARSLGDHKRSYAIAKRLKSGVWMAMAASNMGEVESALGRSQEALPLLLRAERSFREHGITDAQSMAYLNDLIASVMLREKKYAEARRRFQATDTAAIADMPRYMTTHYERLAEFYHATGEDGKAYACARHARGKEMRMMQELFSEQMAEAHARYQKDKNVASQKAEIKQQQARVRILLATAILVIAIAGGGIAIMVLHARRKRQVLRLRHQREYARLTLQSLRNRISPHFVMNLLGREARADDERMMRLVRFIRQNLKLVDQAIIPLAEELDFVDDYIELERKSLAEKFTYTCEVSAGVDVKSLLVPAMTVQLFVENAFKHGLRGQHKDLFLKISVWRLGASTVISIENNGASSQANPSSTRNGIRMVNQAIDMFNRDNERHFKLDYGQDDGGVWRVVISIPDGFKYNI